LHVFIRTHGKEVRIERKNKITGPARKNAHPTTDRGIESNPVDDNRMSPTVSWVDEEKNKREKKANRGSRRLLHSPARLTSHQTLPGIDSARSSWGAVVRGEAAAAARVKPSPTKHKPLAITNSPESRATPRPWLPTHRSAAGRSAAVLPFETNRLHSVLVITCSRAIITAQTSFDTTGAAAVVFRGGSLLMRSYLGRVPFSIARFGGPFHADLLTRRSAGSSTVRAWEYRGQLEGQC
jgi:hypothetical protein